MMWCTKISLFVLLYKAYRYAFFLAYSLYLYLTKRTSPLPHHHLPIRWVETILLRSHLSERCSIPLHSWYVGRCNVWVWGPFLESSQPNPWSCGFLEIQETGRSNFENEERKWEMLIFQLSIAVLYTVHCLSNLYILLSGRYFPLAWKATSSAGAACANHHFPRLRVVRDVKSFASRGLWRNVGTLRGDAAGVTTTPNCAEMFFVFFKVILIVEFHFMTRLSVYWRETEKAYILAIEGFVGSFRRAVCNWCNLCAFYIISFLASAWSSCNSFIIGGVVGLSHVKWCGICKKTYCSKVAVSSCFI